MGPPWNYRKFAGVLKIATYAKLQLPWIRGRSKAERFGWRCRAVAVGARSAQYPSLIAGQTANHVIDTGEICPVEDVESFKGQLKKHGFFERKASGNACIETIKRLADTCVTALTHFIRRTVQREIELKTKTPGGKTYAV